jgi:isoleucyl-tRNA synthetase
MSAASIRRACRKYAEKWIDVQRKDFKRLGVLGAWDSPYLTMAPKYQAVIAQAFVDFLDKGYAYKGLKPVNWCLSCKTALAEAEVEYEDHKSPSIWVRFSLKSDAAAIAPGTGREKGLWSDLDHYPVDHSREPRNRLSSTLRIRCAGSGR